MVTQEISAMQRKWQKLPISLQDVQCFLENYDKTRQSKEVQYDDCDIEEWNSYVAANFTPDASHVIRLSVELRQKEGRNVQIRRMSNDD